LIGLTYKQLNTSLHDLWAWRAFH